MSSPQMTRMFGCCAGMAASFMHDPAGRTGTKVTRGRLGRITRTG